MTADPHRVPTFFGNYVRPFPQEEKAMKKIDELAYGCMARAKDDEMTFVLLSRDAAAPETIRFWCRERIRLGKNGHGDPKVVEALACAEEMERQRLAPVPQ